MFCDICNMTPIFLESLKNSLRLKIIFLRITRLGKKVWFLTNKPARFSSCSQDTGSMPILGSMTTRVNEPRFTISSRRGCMWPPSHLMHTPIICDNVYSLMVARSYNAVIASSQFENDVVLCVIHDGATPILHHNSSIMILVSAPLQLPPSCVHMMEGTYHVLKQCPFKSMSLNQKITRLKSKKRTR